MIEALADYLVNDLRLLLLSATVFGAMIGYSVADWLAHRKHMRELDLLIANTKRVESDKKAPEKEFSEETTLDAPTREAVIDEALSQSYARDYRAGKETTITKQENDLFTDLSEEDIALINQELFGKK